MKLPTSIELNGLPLYASANSAASVGLKNFKTTNERFGAKSLGRGESATKLDTFSNATIWSHIPDYAKVTNAFHSGRHKG